MLEEIRTLKKPKSKRIFVLVSLLALALELVLLWLIDYYRLAVGNIYVEVVKEVLLNIVATTITAIILVLIVVYFIPEVYQEIDIDILDPERTKREHDRTLRESTFWYHNGHLGRWVRTDAMPFLSRRSIDNSIPTNTCLIILNPRNEKVCEEYLRYRLGITFKENNITTLNDVKAELLATIVCGQLYHQDPSGLKVTIFLKNQLALVREDINSCAVFRTQVNPRANCIVYYNKSQKDYTSNFYNTASTNFEFESRFCEVVELKNRIDIHNKRELDISILKDFLSRNSLLLFDDDAFLNNVLNRVISDYNPYK